MLKKNEIKVPDGIAKAFKPALGTEKFYEYPNWRIRAIINSGTPVCQKCGKQAEFRSIINGELEYQLCRECFAKRNKEDK